MLLKLQQNRNLLIFIAGAVGTFLLYLWGIELPIFDVFIKWVEQNFVLYFLTLTLIKVIAIVWPPLPGSILTLGSIPIIGWFPAYLADTLGTLIGASIAYNLGKKYGWEFLNKFFDKHTLKKIKTVKIIKDRELEAIVVLRIFYGTISEVISYGSGLLGVGYKNFILGTIIWAVIQMPIFYIFRTLLLGQHVWISILGLVIAFSIFVKLKNRYFE